MNYLEKLLVPGETIAHLARRSVIVTFGPLLALQGALAAALIGLSLWMATRGPESWVAWSFGIAVAATLAPLPMLIARYVWWRHKSYVVTTHRVLKVEGVFAKDHRDASLDKINDLVLTQSLSGRLLGYGNLQILTANETSGVTYHWLSRPVEFKKRVIQSREAAMPASGRRDEREGDPLAQIERLAKLRDSNAITEEEFQAKKKSLMERIG